MKNRKIFSLAVFTIAVLEFLIFWLIGVLGTIYTAAPFMNPYIRIQLFFLFGAIIIDIPIFALILYYTQKQEKQKS
jgi:hypothetical protein